MCIDIYYNEIYNETKKKVSESVLLTKGVGMTIKEIAKLSNVSISTVSKIMNGKDQSISSETREKVLQIAREYHYIPYDNIAGVSRFLIGAVVKDSPEGRLLLDGMNRQAMRRGYGIVCCQYEDQEDSEKKAIAFMCSHNISTVIWQRDSRRSMEYLHYFEQKGTEVYFCDLLDEEEEERQFSLDYGRYGYAAAEYLYSKHHRRIGCCVPRGAEGAERFVKGIAKCLYNYGLEYRPDFIWNWDEEQSLNNMMLYGVTGIVCFDEEITADVYKKAVENGYKVPQELSVLGMTKQRKNHGCYPKLTEIYLPVEELGEYACRQVIARLEKLEEPEAEPEIRILEGESAGFITDKRSKKIVVIGSINMDSVINVNHFPVSGQTCVAESLNAMTGGKGFNQAVGAAKLGAEVVLIGKIGQDYEAKIVRDTMAGYGIRMDGILESAVGGTGKAYITVQKNGESNIIVYAGANKYLSEADIDKNRYLFAGADFCLLQLETPMKTVEYAAKAAREQGILVILKPAAVEDISDELLKQVDIFIPNRKEIDKLYKADGCLEDKAQYFLDKGVKDIIVTLDEHGCFWKNNETSLYFEAADFQAVDTTGAADAFISALAVYLAEGFPMAEAIKYATYAAGFSITRNGVQSAMVDRSTMDMYAEKIGEKIKTREAAAL